MKRSMLLLAVLALVAATCTSGEEPEPTPSPSPTGPTATVSPSPELDLLPVSMVSFAPFTFVPLLGEDAPAYVGPPTPDSLEGVRIAPPVQDALSDPAVEATLSEQGFVVVPADFRLFHFAYQGNVYEGWPVYVTTDVAYHVWHQAFDKLLRSVEQEVLLPELEALVTGLLEGARAQAAELEGTPLAESADRVEQLFEVAAAELELPVEPGPLAEAELALIEEHTAANEASPIVLGRIDYSLFTPRGHYTRTEELTRYFLGMSVLGQLASCLPGTTGCPSGVEPSRLAILSARVLTADPELVERWHRLYDPTAFLVGLADDYTPFEVAEAATAATPSGLEDPSAFEDDEVVGAVIDELVATRPVRINPDRAAVRLMGTRFVIDSYLFDQLIYPHVGTAEEPRTLPSALDLAAAFGSSFAYDALDEAGATGFEGYDAQLERMRELLATRPEQDWGGTVYDAWLLALEPSFVEHGSAFPDLMRTDAWAAKALQSGLGSYAELKHDTILYAKQSIGEGGDGATIPERRNWVEPDPVVFGRLAAMAELMRAGLEERDLLTREQTLLLRDVVDLFAFLEEVARDELAGLPISEADNDRLTFIGSELEALWFRTSDQAANGQTQTDEDAAIVADVASDPASVLEVATGRIDRIYVLVPDDEGSFQVAVGGVYAYYEFTGPAGQRLTDEGWRAMLDDDRAPPRPGWQEVLFAA